MSTVLSNKHWLVQLHSDSNGTAPCATDEQIKKAAALMKRIDLKDFSVCQFANPGMLLPHWYKDVEKWITFNL